MKKRYDIIVIGGGHNGLTNATYLAKKGKKVLLLEKREILGGIAAGEEFFPGYQTCGLLNDTSTVRLKVIKDLQLERHGLILKSQRPSVALLSDEGGGLLLSGNREETFAEIKKHSKSDALAYLELNKFIDKIRPFITSLQNDIPPDLINLGPKQLLALGKKGIGLKRLGKTTMTELLKVAPMSVSDFLDEYFESDFIKAGLAAPSCYGSVYGPWSSYTNYNFLSYECSSSHVIKGGPHALVIALEKAAQDAGVDIHVGNSVDKILLDNDGVVKGVVVDSKEIKTPIVSASCTPQETFFNLLEPYQISHNLEHDLQNYRARGTTAKVNMALSQKIRFNFSPEREIEFARTANSFEDMERASDAVKYGHISEKPLLDIHIPTVSNPSFAPQDHSVLSVMVHFAPFDLKGGWTDKNKAEVGKKVSDILKIHSNLSDEKIVGQEVLTPVDLENKYGLTQGHIFHGEHALDQLITRPISSCARYKTPIPGLFLSGSGSHPGGGITCMPGALSAQMIMK